MKHFFMLMSVFITFSALSQTTFKEAYYITTEGDSIAGFIKDYDWRYNPKEFVFKKDENSEEQKIPAEEVLYFEILNTSKFISRKVEIDVSSTRVANLSKKKSAELETQHLFLRTLVEGEVNLYKYERDIYVRYFIETKANGLQQLVYKKYVNNNDNILTNNRFRQQLLLNLDCDQLNSSSFEKLKYREKPLVKLVKKHNSCFADAPEKVSKKAKTDKSFFFSIRPGVQYASLTEEFSSNPTRNFEYEFSFRFGIEVEYVLPFHNRKWSVIFEPNYQYYSSTIQIEPLFLERFREVDYQSLVLNAGVRHYFFLNSNQQIFINAGVAQDIPFNSFIGRTDGGSLDIDPVMNAFVGAGFRFNKRISFEIRSHINRNLLSSYVSRSTNFSSFELVFGYTW